MANPQQDAASDVAAITSHALRLGYRATKLGFNVLEGGLRQGLGTGDRYAVGQFRGQDGDDKSVEVDDLALKIGRQVGDLSRTSLQFLLAVLRDLNLGDLGPIGLITVKCVVKGNKKAKAAPMHLLRPKKGDSLIVRELRSPHTSKTITDIGFVKDDDAGFHAVVTVSADQPPGIYSGLVFGTPEEELPLGWMVVTVGKAA